MEKEDLQLQESPKKFSFKNFFSRDMSSSKKIKFIIVGVLFVTLIGIFLSSFSYSSDTDNDSSSNLGVVGSYAKDTEDRLQNILSGIKGIGRVDVFVYVTQSEEIVYMQDTESTSTNNGTTTTKTETKTTIFDKNGNAVSAVVVVTKYPKIEGILIVAGGANDVKLKLKIIDAVSCILSIAPSNIEVLEGKS